MQTRSPASSALPASRNACKIIFGPPLGEIGIAFIDRSTQPMNGLSKYSAIDHEPDRAVGAGDDEEAVGERDVVGHQQCAPLARDVRPADDAHAIERVCQTDHDEPQEGVGHEGECPEEAAGRERSRPPRNVPCAATPGLRQTPAPGSSRAAFRRKPGRSPWR